MEIKFNEDSVIIDGTEYQYHFEVMYVKTLVSILKHIYDNDAVVSINANRVTVTQGGKHSSVILSRVSIDIPIILKGLLYIIKDVRYEVSPIVYHSKKLTIEYEKVEYKGISANYDTIYRLLQAIADNFVIKVEPKEEEPEVEETPVELEPEPETSEAEEVAEETDNVEEIEEEGE